ncbi:MAG: hypothetical protein NC434_08690 [Ruminococcus sp.]|nr:hypothetical protein [Ruminococcus sp.]
MRAKWRKAIWAILAVQLLLWHLLFLENNRGLDYLLNRVVNHFNLPFLLYLHWKRLALFVWFVSAAGVMALHYLNYIRFRRSCIDQLNIVSEAAVRKSLEAAALEAGLHGKKREQSFLYRSKEVREPFLIGFREPVLILPDREYSEGVLYFIFLHECYHIRHKDTLYKLFMLFVQSLLWFQPLMYLLKAVSYRDVEVACDEAVVEGKDMEARKEYGYALLECLKMERVKGQAYSTYFYHGKQMMKARIAAIMKEDKRWDLPAYCAISVLLLDVAFSFYRIGGNLYEQYTIRQEAAQAEVSCYEGYELPEAFTQTAVDEMIRLEPVSEDAYYNEWSREDVYERKDYAALPYEAEGPWQVRIQDADRYGDAVSLLLQRYISYFEGPDQAPPWLFEDTGYSLAETVHMRLLAGNREEAVFAMIGKYCIGYTEEELAAFPQELKDRAQIAREGNTYYAYFDWTLRMRMVKDYVFELEGIAETEDVLQAYTARYARADFSDIPEMDLVYGIKNIPAESGTPGNAYQTDISDGVLRVSGADGVWEEVPITLAELFTRGDEMDGKLTSLQDGSYQVDENKIIFAYGGDGAVPFSVVFYEEESQSYKKSVVTNEFYGGRRIFVDFPESGEEGFLIFTGDRVVWQETTILFHTLDGGKSWQYVGPAGPDMMTESHSLTTGAVFINNRVGFVTIRDSERPDIWRTQDGGQTWEQQELTDVPEYYSMAYAPEVQGDMLCLYVGMEEYSEYGGTKARYESTDEGKTWEYKGLVVRK